MIPREAPTRLRPTLDRFASVVLDRVIPLETAFIRSGFDAVAEDLDSIRRAVREEGLWAPQLPEDLGGMGLTLPDVAHVSRLLGRSPLGHFAVNCHAPDAGTMELLLDHGSEEHKERYLAPLAAGEIRSCFAMTEPGTPGSNPTLLAARAHRVSGGWRIEGRKWFASGADGAAFAVVMAVTDPEAHRHRRASMFLVPTDAPGYRLDRNIPVMGEVGSGWASHGEVVFEGVTVGQDALIGEVGDGFALAQERLGPGRIHHCMRWLGIADRALELLCRRALGRRLTSRTNLAEQPVVREWIAETAVAIDGAALLVLDAAERVEAQGPKAARDRISGIKFHVAGVMLDALDRAIQVHGGAGLTDDTPLAWLWRHERGARIYDGPDEVHKMVVAREVLGRFGDEARD